MRLTDILLAFPYILLGIAVVARLGPGLRHAMIAIAIVGFPLSTRLVRGIVLSHRGREFVETAWAPWRSADRGPATGFGFVSQNPVFPDARPV